MPSGGTKLFHPLAYVVIVHPIGNRSGGVNAGVKLFHPLPYNAYNRKPHRTSFRLRTRGGKAIPFPPLRCNTSTSK